MNHFSNRLPLGVRLLLLAVFLLPSLVPAGYMLQRNQETDVVEVTVCPGVNHRSAWMDEGHGHHSMSPVEDQTGRVAEALKQTPDGTAQHEGQSELCPLAVSGAALTMDTCSTGALPSGGLPVALAMTTRVTAADLPIPPARGPPPLA